MINYFELMNLPQRYQIDLANLQQALRQLQAKFHPDTNLEASSLQKNLANHSEDKLLTNDIIIKLGKLKPEQASAIINEAYNTLKNPDSRAAHLLELKGISQSINHPIRDLDFLDDAMTFRMELEEANDQFVKSLNQKLNVWLTSYENSFDEIYQKIDSLDSSNNEYTTLIEQATDLIQKLQFLVKLQADVAKTTDELAKHSFDNDDDLYV